jgi:hypothetical protein
MVPLAALRTRKKEASGQVSTLTRTLALGELALSWAFLTVHEDPLKWMVKHVPSFLILALTAATLLVIAFDLLQYVAITKMADDAINRTEGLKAQEGQYNANSLAYQAQKFCYKTKFGMLLIASALLLVIFILLFTAPQPAEPRPATQNNTLQKPHDC